MMLLFCFKLRDKMQAWKSFLVDKSADENRSRASALYIKTLLPINTKQIKARTMLTTW